MAARSTSLLGTALRLTPTSSAVPRVAVGRCYLSTETSAQTSTPEIPAIPRKTRPENAVYNAKNLVKAPVAMRPRTPYPVNTDVDKLNKVIERLTGPEIELPQELKWQIVTHKSFDHGRQPFNQKLALFGTSGRVYGGYYGQN